MEVNEKNIWNMELSCYVLHSQFIFVFCQEKQHNMLLYRFDVKKSKQLSTQWEKCKMWLCIISFLV